MMSNLPTSYRELQAIAKQIGIPANIKKEEMIIGISYFNDGRMDELSDFLRAGRAERRQRTIQKFEERRMQLTESKRTKCMHLDTNQRNQKNQTKPKRNGKVYKADSRTRIDTFPVLQNAGWRSATIPAEGIRVPSRASSRKNQSSTNGPQGASNESQLAVAASSVFIANPNLSAPPNVVARTYDLSSYGMLLMPPNDLLNANERYPLPLPRDPFLYFDHSTHQANSFLQRYNTVFNELNQIRVPTENEMPREVDCSSNTLPNIPQLGAEPYNSPVAHENVEDHEGHTHKTCTEVVPYREEEHVPVYEPISEDSNHMEVVPYHEEGPDNSTKVLNLSHTNENDNTSSSVPIDYSIKTSTLETVAEEQPCTETIENDGESLVNQDPLPECVYCGVPPRNRDNNLSSEPTNVLHNIQNSTDPNEVPYVSRSMSNHEHMSNDLSHLMASFCDVSHSYPITNAIEELSVAVPNYDFEASRNSPIIDNVCPIYSNRSLPDLAPLPPISTIMKYPLPTPQRTELPFGQENINHWLNSSSSDENLSKSDVTSFELFQNAINSDPGSYFSPVENNFYSAIQVPQNYDRINLTVDAGINPQSETNRVPVEIQFPAFASNINQADGELLDRALAEFQNYASSSNEYISYVGYQGNAMETEESQTSGIRRAKVYRKSMNFMYSKSVSIMEKNQNQGNPQIQVRMSENAEIGMGNNIQGNSIPFYECNHKNDGCSYYSSNYNSMELHENECCFQQMECPVSRCFWKNPLMQLNQHILQNHGECVRRGNEFVYLINRASKEFKNNSVVYFQCDEGGTSMYIVSVYVIGFRCYARLQFIPVCQEEITNRTESNSYMQLIRFEDEAKLKTWKGIANIYMNTVEKGRGKNVLNCEIQGSQFVVLRVLL